MGITIIDIVILMAVNSLSVILSALVTGYLVFRSKRENHERLFPQDKKRKAGPIIKDEFADWGGVAQEPDPASVLSEIMQSNIQRMAAQQAVDGLKERERE